jgi:hypothetical protein
MPTNPPLRAAGPRDPRKQPRRVPQAVKTAILLMVYGDPDDPDCAVLDFIEAGRRAGIKPDVMRRYLDRSEVRSMLRAERQAFRAAICAGNEGALQRIRDKSENAMAQLGAIKVLESIDADSNARPQQNITPHVTIRIVQPNPTPPMIDVSPGRTIEQHPALPATRTRHEDTGD